MKKNFCLLVGLLCLGFAPPACCEELPAAQSAATSSEAVIETVDFMSGEVRVDSTTPFAATLVSLDGSGQTGELLLNGKSALTLRGDDGTTISELARRLNELKLAGDLRTDRIHPARRDGRYSVMAGEAQLLVVTSALARADGCDRFSLTLKLVNRIRSALGGAPYQQQASRGGFFQGVASWYGGFFHGRTAANGERFDQWAMTAAHKTLPFGTLLLVTNLGNNQSTVVRITDRGPFIPGRTIDLSHGAARAIGMIHSGVVKVKLSILGLDERLGKRRR